MQRPDLISKFDADTDTFIDVIFYHSNNSKAELFLFNNIDILFVKLIQYSEYNQVRIEIDGGSASTLIKKHLKAKQLVDTLAIEHPIKNYMKFHVFKEVVTDKMIRLSFKSILDSSGQDEKERLIEYIKERHEITFTFLLKMSVNHLEVESLKLPLN